MGLRHLRCDGWTPWQLQTLASHQHLPTQPVTSAMSCWSAARVLACVRWANPARAGDTSAQPWAAVSAWETGSAGGMGRVVMAPRASLSHSAVDACLAHLLSQYPPSLTHFYPLKKPL